MKKGNDNFRFGFFPRHGRILTRGRGSSPQDNEVKMSDNIQFSYPIMPTAPDTMYFNYIIEGGATHAAPSLNIRRVRPPGSYTTGDNRCTTVAKVCGI